MSLFGSRVSLLVLANLGVVAAAACRNNDAVLVVPTQPIPSASAAGSASPLVSASAAPSATPSAAPVANVSASPSARTSASASAASLGTQAPAPGACKQNSDCGPDGPPGAHTCEIQPGQTTGVCKHQRYFLGRALVVEGRARLAPLAATGDDHVAWLTSVAREEHASIAAFARTIAELMALGAPLELIADTQAALADEVRHARGALEALERATGTRAVFGLLPEAAAPLRTGADAAERLLRDVFRGGAVGETLAAADADRARMRSVDPLLRSFLDGVVVDEARHAALAIRTLRWLVVAHDGLDAVLDEELAAFARDASEEARALVLPLLAHAVSRRDVRFDA